MILRDIPYGEEKAQVLDLFLPEQAEKMPIYIYFHGGGLGGGSKNHYGYMGEYFNQHGIAFASVEYRMYPNAKYPDYIDDCASAVRYIYDNYSDKLSYITVGGSSAGGYLTMMLYFDKHYLKDIPEEFIRGYVFDAGQPTTHFNLLATERKVDGRRIVVDEAAPIYYLDKPFEGYMPQILITCCDHDMVNRMEQNRMLYIGMLHFGYDKEKIQFICYENEKHCAYVNKDFYLEDVLALIKRS